MLVSRRLFGGTETEILTRAPTAPERTAWYLYEQAVAAAADNDLDRSRALIEMASSFYTLHPGDIIITGTPEGVSPIVPGDTIVASIEKIGSMEVSVRAAEV